MTDPEPSGLSPTSRPSPSPPQRTPAGQRLAHETLAAEEPLGPGSDRAFGIVFTVVFSVIACLPLLGGRAPLWWLLALAAALLALAFWTPRLLHPANRLWFRFGMLLHCVMTPVILFVLYLLSVLPVGLLMRALGKDPLRLRLDRNATSYWIEREPPGPTAGSLENQF